MSNITELTEKQKRPGTKSARASGCTCPVMDNHYGKGYGGDGPRYGWITNEDCQLHSPKGGQK